MFDIWQHFLAFVFHHGLQTMLVVIVNGMVAFGLFVEGFNIDSRFTWGERRAMIASGIACASLSGGLVYTLIAALQAHA